MTKPRYFKSLTVPVTIHLPETVADRLHEQRKYGKGELVVAALAGQELDKQLSRIARKEWVF